MAATTLAQIITIEQGVRPDAEAEWRGIRDLITKTQLMVGYTKTFEPLEGTGTLPQPPEVKKVQVNVELLLAELQEKLTRWWDVTLTKDSGNTGTDGARADVIVNGQVVLASAPATFLLFLDKRLAELHTGLSRVPAQSAAEDWVPSTERGIFRTEQERVPSTTKVTDFRIVVPATDKFPADVREVSKDIQTGIKTTVKFTSAPTDRWLRAVLARITSLREAVQMAIHEANKTEVRDQHAGEALFGFIFNGDSAE